MDTLKNKKYVSFDYLSRYTSVPYYYDTTKNREIFGIGTNMKTTTEYVTHIVKSGDTLNYLALKYYNNPTFWWIIAYFNNIQDAFVPLTRYKTLKIPNISGVEFGEVNK